MKNLKIVFDQMQEENPPLVIPVEDTTASSAHTQQTMPINPVSETALNENSSKKRRKKKLKKDRIVANRIAFLENKPCYLGLAEDHLIFWFNNTEELVNLMDQIHNYKMYGSKETHSQDFGCFLKLTRHALVVFYQKDKLFNSVSLTAFFKEKIKVKPFAGVYKNLIEETKDVHSGYLSSLQSHKSELSIEDSYYAKLHNYYNLKNSKFLTYLESNIMGSETAAQPEKNNSMEEKSHSKEPYKKNKEKKSKRETAEKNKIKLLEKAEYYESFNEEKDHLIFWFSDNEDLDQLVDQIASYNQKRKGMNTALCQDLGRILKLSKHALAVFYQKDKTFNSAILNDFFEKIKIKPFVEIYENLQQEAESSNGAYLCSLVYHEAELADENSYFAKLKRYYAWEDSEFIKYIENITPTIEKSFATSFGSVSDHLLCEGEAAVIQDITENEERPTKKQRHMPKTKEQSIVEKGLAFLTQATCYESFKEKEKDHLIFWFNDKKILKKFKILNQEFKNKNPQETSYRKDLMRFFIVGDHILFVFYQPDMPFNSESLNIHFKNTAIYPIDKISVDLKTQLLEAKWSLIVLKHHKHTPEREGYVTKLWEYYNAAGDQSFWGKFFEFMENKVQEQQTESLAGTEPTELAEKNSNNELPTSEFLPQEFMVMQTTTLSQEQEILPDVTEQLIQNTVFNSNVHEEERPDFPQYIEDNTSMSEKPFFTLPSWRETLVQGVNQQFEQNTVADLNDRMETNDVVNEKNIGKEEEKEEETNKEMSPQYDFEINFLTF